jgi:mannan-binding lectin serine protease 2
MLQLTQNLLRLQSIVAEGVLSCRGDSGGGLMFLDKKVRRWFVRGIVSFGKVFEVNNTLVCSNNTYPVYVDVARHLSWIVEKVPDIS